MKRVKLFSAWFIILLVVTSLLITAGCTSAPSPSPAPSPKPSPSPAPSPAPSPTPSPKPSPSPAPSPSPSPSPAALTIKTASKTGLGDFLVDTKGMTLYYFTRDVIGKSVATGAVLQAWPIFYAANITLPASLNAADFSTITRDDGQKQTAYKGWPLYYYAKDLAAGDTLGEAVGGVWFIMKVPFYTVMLQTKADIGNYLVDAKGMTLYYFTRDTAGKSNATAAIIANWPIFYSANNVVLSNMNASDFATITRDDGKMQTTYKGWPLYYYIKDLASGDTTGQGVNSIWYVINPQNFPPTPTPTTMPASIQIVSPSGMVSAGSVRVAVTVSNFVLVDKLGQTNAPGQGHIHYFLDVNAPTTPGQPAVTAAGTYAPTAATSYTWPNVTAGVHTFSAELVNNDHTPLVPPVVAKVTITVTATSGGGGY